MLFNLIFSVCLIVCVNGVPGNRINGGTPVEIQKYPFAVALLTNNGQGSYSHGCGGTLLTNRAILSAASCFYTGSEAHPAGWWRVRVGSSLSSAGSTIYAISLITPNPGFSPVTLDNDIAVLKTNLAIPLIPGSVEVARMAGRAYSFGVNQRVLAIGWGATSDSTTSFSPQLREAQIWTIDRGTCANRWNTVNFAITDNMVCAGWLDVGTRAQCHGDEGSPLLHETEGFVVGVFTRSSQCTEGWYPGVNTQVPPYARWIESVALQ